MSSSSTFSPSSFLSFFDFPVVAATSATASSSSSASSHSHAQRPSSLFDLSCLQPDINSPPVVTSPVPAAAPHSHFFPAGAGAGGAGHTRSASTSTLSTSSSSPSLRSSLPPSNASSLSSCVSPKSPPTAASAANAPPLAAASASSGQGAFGFELSSLTSWLDSLFPAEDAATPPAQQLDGRRQHADSAAARPSAQHTVQSQSPAASTQSAGSRRPCRPRLSPSSSSPASSASLVRALSSNPKRAAAQAASAKGDVNIAHPASSPMSIARTSALLSRKSAASTSPPSPPVDLDEKVASLLADREQRSARGGGALSPLPEVQLVEALTPDSPSHVLTLDVHRTDGATEDDAVHDAVPSGVMAADSAAQHDDVAQQYVDFVIAGIPVGQPPVSPPATPQPATTNTRSALQRSPYSPPSPPPASLLSSALLEADLDYFHVERDAAVAIEQLSTTPPPLPHSPHSADDDGAELAWEDDEEESGEAEDEAQVVRLRGDGRRHGKAGGRADEEDWEVCRVQEGSGGTDDEYEML